MPSVHRQPIPILSLMLALVLMAATPHGAAGQDTTQPPAAPANPVPPATARTVSVASWHIGTATEKAGAPKPAAPKAGNAWRHTFGAERRSAAWRTLAPAGFDAGVIALQGITDLRATRRIFRARTHHVIVSRQILQDSRPAAGVTAVVLRRARGLRATAIHHTLPPTGLTAPQSPLAAAIAVLVQAGTTKFWYVSSDLSAPCLNAATRPDSADCDVARKMIVALVDWKAAREASGIPVVFATAGDDRSWAFAALSGSRERSAETVSGHKTACGALKPILTWQQPATPAASHLKHVAARRQIPRNQPCSLLTALEIQPAQ